MAIEIERKFLVTSDDWRSQVCRSVSMRHGYLTAPGGRASVRVRIEDTVGKLNVKAAVAGASRAEYEYEIPEGEAQEILEKLCEQLILKTRHYIVIGELTWEIDVFEGDNVGLVVAEVELEHEDQEFVRPAWLGREVTSEHRYYNNALALHPYRDWPAADRA